MSDRGLTAVGGRVAGRPRWRTLLWAGIALGCAATLRAQTRAPSPTPSPARSAPPPPASAQTPAGAPAAVKVVPYGIAYFNGFHNTSGTNNGDVPLWATAGRAHTSASGRQSRLGIRL